MFTRQLQRKFTRQLTTTTFRYSSTIPSQTTLPKNIYQYNSKFRFQHNSLIFRPTRPSRDWHQHIDHKTGKFYYENIFTGEKTHVQPQVFLPHDHQKESSAMAFLRTDRAGTVGVQKKKSVLRPLFTAMFITGTLYTLGELGYLDRLFGYKPPNRDIPYDQKVQDRTKAMVQNYYNYDKPVAMI